jgi:anti-sigma regulatory factor (Ser/Thr protein kinase)
MITGSPRGVPERPVYMRHRNNCMRVATAARAVRRIVLLQSPRAALSPASSRRARRGFGGATAGQSLDVALNRPFVLSLPATPESVRIARHELAKVAYGCGADRLAVRSVVSELVGNAVKHAYRDSGPGPVSITAESAPGCLQISVADEGRGMLPPSEHRGLGLGIPLSLQLADDLRVETGADGTTVVASFAAAGG